MALRFLDSFDHYAVADINMKWTQTSAFRDTGLHGNGVRGSLRKGMRFPTNTMILEAYIKGVVGPGGQLFAIFDDGNNAVESNTQQISCAVGNDGSVSVRRYGSNPATDVITTTPPDLVRGGTWYHIGWTVLVHLTAGAIEVRLNGATIISLTGIPTVNHISSSDPSPYWSGTIGMFELGDSANSIIFDDLVVMDDVADGISDPRLPGGGGFTKFLGPVEIKVKRPSGVGTLAEWTPTPTVPNWQNVDDIESDGDTTYNAADFTAVGASDLFAMENLAVDEDVVAVQSLVLAKKTQEGVAAIAKLNNDGTTTRVGPTVYQPSTYSYIHAPEPTAPDGSLWTKAKWDAIQYGYRRIV
jgi:hypothetical protein